MVNDSEPRYRLVDSNGNIVGSLYAKSNGDVALQEGTNEEELTFDSNGDLNVPNALNSAAVNTEQASIEEMNFGSRETVTIDSNNVIQADSTIIRPDGSTSTTLEAVVSSDGNTPDVGDFLIIAGNGNFDITVVHRGSLNDGEFALDGQTDKTLNSFDDVLVCFCGGGGNWTQISFSDAG